MSALALAVPTIADAEPGVTSPLNDVAYLTWTAASIGEAATSSPDSSILSWAYWQHVGLVGALLSAVLGAMLATILAHLFMIWRARRAEKDRLQRILCALYVEVFARAARCARDADTWCKEAKLEKERSKGTQKLPRRRNIKVLLKFEPSPPVVYPALAESHGHLDPDVQAALSEFYYRLEAVMRDVNRFARKPWDAEMEPGDIHHLALVLHDACAPAQEAIKQLRAGIDDHTALDRKLSASYEYMFEEPEPLGATIDEVLERVIEDWPPKADS